MMKKIMTTKLFLMILLLALIGGGVWYWGFNDRSDATQTKIPVQSVSKAKGWQNRCLKNQSDRCEIFQNVYVNEGDQSLKLVEISVGQNGDNLFFAISTVAGIDQTKGYGVQIDDGAILEIPINQCQQGQCMSLSKLADDFVIGMKRGNILSVYFVDGAGKVVRVEFTLQGFTKASENL